MALRQSLIFVNMPTMPQPEVYLAHSNTLFDEAGKLNNDGTAKFLTGFMQSFETWIGKFV
jgi:chromate reductase